MEQQKPVRKSSILKEDKKNAGKQFIREFIEVYRDLPGLWDVNSKEYTNRLVKAEQYRILINKYQEYYPEADKEEVTKKINCLRTNFRKEVKRIREAQESGTNPADEVPRLWYFEEMSFLANQDTPKASITKTDISFHDEDMVMEPDMESIEQETPTTSNGNMSIKHEMNSASRTENRKRNSSAPIENSPKMASRYQPPTDDSDKIASVWAAELRKMNPQQQLFAKKAINDILFEGQMGTLHRNAVEINASHMVFTPSNHSACMSPPNSS
ncbi:uncharacterized protein LOC125957280 [Anopheles darlingi]|uniref:uncharacterized protein LOC125957280 n=1 Tax=Anopheles darlingi TaxID=43151 RepID=UPI00210008C6|nr:uncharacterized protein LOC125957280 [Anopheles darlingi]XP_049545837.1 uncharacterized protein LOC125957280 [Anopheles darlingi]XP_049545838.1 uncharacterized protein LOC125957280 [Anopheles darlingi]